MKRFITLTVLLLTMGAIAAAQTETPEPEKFKITWEWAVIAITATYEFIARVIPTPKDYTVLGKIFKGLKFLSDFLNRKSK